MMRRRPGRSRGSDSILPCLDGFSESLYVELEMYRKCFSINADNVDSIPERVERIVGELLLLPTCLFKTSKSGRQEA